MESQVLSATNPQVMAGIQAGAVLHFLNQLENKADEIIAALPAMEDDAVLEIRMQAKGLGRAAWRIECAADAEILKRESQRRGQGVKDIEQKGVMAAVRKHAAEVGVEPRTIMRNAAIHKTFFDSDSAVTNKNLNGVTDILQDKGFYDAAQQSDNPHATLEHFAQQKSENPFFSTRDAWRYVRELDAPTIDAPVPPLIEDDQVRAWYQDFQIVINRAPGQGLRRILRDVIDEVRDYVQRPVANRRAQLLALVAEGIDEQDLIAAEINVDRIHVAVWLNRLEEEGVLTHFEKERAPGARGAARTGYRLTPEGQKRMKSNSKEGSRNV